MQVPEHILWCTALPDRIRGKRSRWIGPIKVSGSDSLSFSESNILTHRNMVEESSGRVSVVCHRYRVSAKADFAAAMSCGPGESSFKLQVSE